MATKNLTSENAISKMTDLVENIEIGMMLTDLGNQPIDAIPMRTKKVDERGDIWFLSELSSDHNFNIVRDSNVQLIYGDPSDMDFISIYGEATVVCDDNILEQLYSHQDDAWFTGKEDPNLTAIKVTPQQAYYWDTKQNKYLSLFKMGVSAVTGHKFDIGEKGKLNL
jgi:general stress protein 26